MPAIKPKVLDDTDASTDRIAQSFRRLGGADSDFVQILAHAPGYAQAVWGAMAEALFEGTVDHRLKEMMRIQLASTANDPYFSELRSAEATESGLTEERIAAALGDFERDSQFTEAEKWALRYSYLMYRRPEDINNEFYEEGKRHFSEAQIMEMGGLIAIHYGLAVFMSTLHSE